MKTTNVVFLVALCSSVILPLSHGLEGQCAMADRCCVGRDSSCVVHGLQKSYGGYGGAAMVDEPCYCDEGCLETGDCCSDYQQICNVERKNSFFYAKIFTPGPHFAMNDNKNLFGKRRFVKSQSFPCMGERAAF